MSMVKTLARAAVGMAVAKGVSSMMRSGGGRSSGGGMEDLLGAVMGGGTSRRSRSSSTGGLEDLLGAVMGGGRGRRGSTGGVDELLGAVLGGSTGTSRSGGIGGALGQVFAGAGPRGRGSLGGALEELSQMSGGGRTAARGDDSFSRPGQGSFGELLNSSLDRFGEPERSPTAQEEAQAQVLLRALIMAAKADGTIDSEEKKQLTSQLGELDAEDIAFVNAELGKPVDPDDLARDTPRGSEAQVYMMALLSIDLDTKQEAQFLGELARALGINGDQANAIHDRMGEPRIFR